MSLRMSVEVPFFSRVYLFFQGMAVTALVSRAMESQDIPKAQRALTAGLSMAVVAGLLTTGAYHSNLRPLISLWLKGFFFGILPCGVRRGPCHAVFH